MSYKSGFVAVIGRPNVGKSTLLNTILGQKIAITSDKPQTTRKRIRGIYTSEKGQIVFTDTPGVHKPLYELGEFLLEEAKLAIPDADLLLFIVDGSEKAGRGDKWIVDNLINIDIPVIMVLNKIELVKNQAQREEITNSYKELFGEKPVTCLKISAKTGRNIEDLIKNIYRKLPKGAPFYPEEEITDQNLRTVTAEIIREKILHNTTEEIPHSIAVIITSFKEEEDLTTISADIFVEFDSQKGIIIGNKGSMLKKIGTSARMEIEKQIDNKVFLDLRVKVRKKWRKNPSALRQFGFSES